MADVRLIDANALRKNLSSRYMNELYPDWRTLPELTRMRIEMLAKEFRFAIDHAPTIDAVPVVHGRWDKPVEHGLPYAANHLGVVCSYCCKWSDNDYNYCPNCGAKMDAEDMDVPTKDGGATDANSR